MKRTTHQHRYRRFDDHRRAERNRSLIIYAVLFWALAVFILTTVGCSSAPTAPSDVQPGQSTVAHAVTVSVTVNALTDRAPLTDATVSTAAGSVYSVNGSGQTAVYAIVGEPLTLTAAAPGFAPFTASAIISGPSERWTFNLERQ